MDRFLAFLENYAGFTPQMLGAYVMIAIKLAFIFAAAKLAIYILNKIVAKIFKLHPKLRVDERKTNTLTGILKSVIKYTIYIIMVISMLEALNIPTQPLLAAAGLGGLAIGFGAQSLVRDVFTGFFILFEDQYSVGDFVTINNIAGTVEDMGLRVTKIRSNKGELNTIPNGEIKIVTNLSRGNAVAMVEVSIAYEMDEEKAMRVLAEAAEAFCEANKENITDKPEVVGITSLGESEVVIRTVLKTLPLMHWKIERGFRKAVLEAFKKNNIEIPYPRRVLLEKKASE